MKLLFVVVVVVVVESFKSCLSRILQAVIILFPASPWLVESMLRRHSSPPIHASLTSLLLQPDHPTPHYSPPELLKILRGNGMQPILHLPSRRPLVRVRLDHLFEEVHCLLWESVASREDQSW